MPDSSLRDNPFNHPPQLAPAVGRTRLRNLPSSAGNSSLALVLAPVSPERRRRGSNPPPRFPTSTTPVKTPFGRVPPAPQCTVLSELGERVQLLGRAVGRSRNTRLPSGRGTADKARAVTCRRFSVPVSRREVLGLQQQRYRKPHELQPLSDFWCFPAAAGTVEARGSPAVGWLRCRSAPQTGHHRHSRLTSGLLEEDTTENPFDCLLFNGLCWETKATEKGEEERDNKTGADGSFREPGDLRQCHVLTLSITSQGALLALAPFSPHVRRFSPW